MAITLKTTKTVAFWLAKKYAHSKPPLRFFILDLCPSPQNPPPKKNKTPELMHWLQRSVCCCGVKIILPPELRQWWRNTCKLILGTVPGKVQPYTSIVQYAVQHWNDDKIGTWFRVYFVRPRLNRKQNEIDKWAMFIGMYAIFVGACKPLCRANLQSYNSP